MQHPVLLHARAGFVYDRDTDQHYELDDPQAMPVLALCSQSTSVFGAPGTYGSAPGNRGAEIHRHGSVPGGAASAHLFAPITLRGELIGAIDAFDLNSRMTWDDNDLTLIQTISSQVALSLDNARLLQETQFALSETETLYQASAELNAINSAERSGCSSW